MRTDTHTDTQRDAAKTTPARSTAGVQVKYIKANFKTQVKLHK